MKSIDEYTNEVKNNIELIKKIANDSVEISKIKEEIISSTRLMNQTCIENTKIIENNFKEIEQKENSLEEQITTISQSNEEQVKIINNSIYNLNIQILKLTKICKILLSLLIFAIVLIIALFIK